MKTKPKKPKKNVWNNEHCDTYDPEVEGYGSRDDWVGSFNFRMGLDEANVILGDDDPRSILGLIIGFTKDQLKTAFRKMAMKWHPDHNKSDGAESMFKKMQAAYVNLGGRG